jgi:type I restriction enzyme S subunit
MTEQITKLPKDWKIVISSDIMDIRDGTHDTPKYVNENGIPLITSKNLKGNEIDFNKVSYISNEDHFEISKRSKVESGDILFAMIGTIGNPAIIKGDANFSIKNVGLFKKNESVILPQFFVNFLRSSFFEKQLNERRLLKGTTQKFIPLGNLRKIEIPFPPIETQQAIVSKIEELFSELDKGIEDLKTAQQQLKTYRQSVLKWAFEGKLTNENVKDGELPEGWEMVDLKQACEVKRGKSKHRPRNAPELYGGDYPFIQTGDIRNANGGYIKRYSQTYSEIGLAQSKLWPKGTLCITIAANIGETAILDFDACFPDSVVGLLSKKDVLLNKYLNYFFISFKQKLEELAPATAQKNINVDILEKVNIPLAPYEEQQLIVQEIESRLSVADKMEESIAQSLQQAEALRQSILKKAFSGGLV